MTTDERRWAVDLLTRLQTLCPLERTLTLEWAEPDHLLWELYPTADGACHVALNGDTTIYLRDHAKNTEYWRDVLIHEYTHAMLGQVFPATPNEEVRRQVESLTLRVGGLLDLALRTGAVVREGGAR